jgi:hypothetical protein
MSRAAVAQQPVLGASRCKVGWIVACGGDDGLLVDFDGNTAGPLAARTTVALEPTTLEADASLRVGVVMVFEDDDATRPIVIGLLREPRTMPATDDREVKLDGTRVDLEGKDEVVLRCGKSMIVLRRNGRVVIRGVTIESQCDGTHRIKGGTVRIN